MKRLLYFAFALFLASCGQGGGSSGTSTAAVPLDQSCLNGSTICNNGVYSGYPGWSAYPMPYGNGYNQVNYFNQNGFCGCPSGSSPAYNSGFGLGCVRTQLLQPYAGFYSYWNFGASASVGFGGGFGGNGYFPGPNGGANPNFGGYGFAAPQQSSTWNQVSNIPGIPGVGGGYGGNCPRQITQSCVIGQVNTCGNATFCRQVMPGSGLGICVNQFFQ